MTIHPKLPSQILQTQTEALKEENIKAENLRGMDKAFEIRRDGTRCIKNRSWLPLFGSKENSIGGQHEGNHRLNMLENVFNVLELRQIVRNHLDSWMGKTLTIEKIVQIRQRLQAARDRQRSYANIRRKPLEFQVGDRVMLKILKRVGPVAYKLELPEELSNVYSTFHVSNLKKCLSDESLIIPMKELRLDDKLNFLEEPVEIMDREVKQLKQSRIPIVKVRWNFKRGP
ncbi:hypothetical protein Tco_0504632 [Tanacetum coccineum]